MIHTGVSGKDAAGSAKSRLMFHFLVGIGPLPRPHALYFLKKRIAIKRFFQMKFF